MRLRSNNGQELIQRGMLPFSRCGGQNAPRATGAEGNLGLPCMSGGSLARAQTDRRGVLIICMLFYLPTPEGATSGGAGQGAANPSESSSFRMRRYNTARDHCRRYQLQLVYVDLTAMAWCIYFNFPNIRPQYPPETSGTGSRLRGLIVIPGGDDGDILTLPGAAIEAPLGSLVFDHFKMRRPGLNLPAVFLTCVCAWPL